MNFYEVDELRNYAERVEWVENLNGSTCSFFVSGIKVGLDIQLVSMDDFLLGWKNCPLYSTTASFLTDKKFAKIDFAVFSDLSRTDILILNKIIVSIGSLISEKILQYNFNVVFFSTCYDADKFSEHHLYAPIASNLRKKTRMMILTDRVVNNDFLFLVRGFTDQAYKEFRKVFNFSNPLTLG